MHKVIRIQNGPLMQLNKKAKMYFYKTGILR